MRLFKQNMTWNRAHDSKALVKTCCYDWRAGSVGKELATQAKDLNSNPQNTMEAGAVALSVLLVTLQWESERQKWDPCKLAGQLTWYMPTKKNRKALSENKLGGKN